MNNRIKYLDVARFLGIFCIYLGHFCQAAGNAYAFVFFLSRPAFFFLSGFSENLSTDIPFKKYIIKNVKCLLIPFYFFALACLVVTTIVNNTCTSIVSDLIQILKGCIRNHFYAGSLWFLSCLFVMKNVFYVLRKALKRKWLILLFCAAFYCTAQLLIDPRPIQEPHMVYNIDSACYYIIFYALGYYGFGPLQVLLDWEKPHRKVICAGIGSLLFIYAALLFFGKDLLTYINTNAVMHLICPVLKALLVILFVLIVSKAMETVALFGFLGKNTLFLCGSEYLIKLFVPLCLQIVGLNLSLPNPLAAYLYTFFLLVLCGKTFIPLEKAVFKRLRLIKQE